jgi:pimeloyl-ACP methyl ester carboxylesterase
MFLEHAKELKARYGHGYVLLDLPGHGSLVEKPLTPDSCAETLGKVLRECGIKADSSEKIIYVGGSLGAYLGFRLLDNFKDIFDAAVLMDCG